MKYRLREFFIVAFVGGVVFLLFVHEARLNELDPRFSNTKTVHQDMICILPEKEQGQ